MQTTLSARADATQDIAIVTHRDDLGVHGLSYIEIGQKLFVHDDGTLALINDLSIAVKGTPAERAEFLRGLIAQAQTEVDRLATVAQP